MRYGTRSADFYRYKLRCLADMAECSEEPPAYDSGRDQITAEESLNKDGGPEGASEGKEEDKRATMDQYEDFIKTGLNSFDSLAVRIAENMEYSAYLAKQKATEAGVTDAIQGTASSVANNLQYYGTAAAAYTS